MCVVTYLNCLPLSAVFSEPFRIGSSGKCPDRIGTHEPNLVLKDNDLTTKIRMKPEEAYEVIDALHKDSDALCQMVCTLLRTTY